MIPHSFDFSAFSFVLFLCLHAQHSWMRFARLEDDSLLGNEQDVSNFFFAPSFDAFCVGIYYIQCTGFANGASVVTARDLSVILSGL